MKCGYATECPNLIEKEDGNFIAIGRKLDESETSDLKIAKGEVASELPREVVLNALKLPKWNGGFKAARKIATEILVPKGNEPEDYFVLDRVAEALVKAYDDGAAAEFYTRQKCSKPGERIREQISKTSATLDMANKSGLSKVLIDGVTWVRRDVGSPEADLMAALDRITVLITEIDILKSRESA